MAGVDATSNRSSSFWATLGQQFLQTAEYTLPQLGAAASQALAMRYGGTAPNVSVQAAENQPGVAPAENPNKWLLIGGAVLVGLIVLFAVARPIRGR